MHVSSYPPFPHLQTKFALKTMRSPLDRDIYFTVENTTLCILANPWQKDTLLSKKYLNVCYVFVMTVNGMVVYSDAHCKKTFDRAVNDIQVILTKYEVLLAWKTWYARHWKVHLPRHSACYFSNGWWWHKMAPQSKYPCQWYTISHLKEFGILKQLQDTIKNKKMK